MAAEGKVTAKTGEFWELFRPGSTPSTHLFAMAA